MVNAINYIHAKSNPANFRNIVFSMEVKAGKAIVADLDRTNFN